LVAVRQPSACNKNTSGEKVNRLLAVLFIALLCQVCNATVINCETDQEIVFDPVFDYIVGNVQGYVVPHPWIFGTTSISNSTGNACASHHDNGAPTETFGMWRAVANWQNDPFAFGGTFSINSFDVYSSGDYGFNPPFPHSILLRGTRGDGSELQTALGVPDDDMFHLFELTGWTDLVSFGIDGFLNSGPGIPAFFLVDNIDVTDTPEPATLLIFGIAMGFFGGCRFVRRRTQASDVRRQNESTI
jgi:hypothetical protein